MGDAKGWFCLLRRRKQQIADQNSQKGIKGKPADEDRRRTLKRIFQMRFHKIENLYRDKDSRQEEQLRNRDQRQPEEPLLRRAEPGVGRFFRKPPDQGVKPAAEPAAEHVEEDQEKKRPEALADDARNLRGRKLEIVIGHACDKFAPGQEKKKKIFPHAANVAQINEGLRALEQEGALPKKFRLLRLLPDNLCRTAQRIGFHLDRRRIFRPGCFLLS